MRGSKLVMSIQPKYLIAEENELYSITFSASKILVRPGDDQTPNFLLETESSNSTTCHLKDFDFDSISLGQPNYGMHKMIFSNWSETSKIQLHGKQKFPLIWIMNTIGLVQGRHTV